ncbi:MAG: CoA-binding protein [Nocardioides sp.]
MAAPLDRMRGARSVAVVGASARPGSFGERLAIEALRSPGFARVDLVNPGYDRVQGIAVADSLDHLDEPPDLVLFGIPDAQVPDQLRAAARLGAGGAVVYGSAAGLGDELRAAAGDMPVCGAGCMGFLNLTRGCERWATWSATRCSPAASPWSRTPGRCSRRC